MNDSTPRLPHFLEVLQPSLGFCPGVWAISPSGMQPQGPPGPHLQRTAADEWRQQMRNQLDADTRAMVSARTLTGGLCEGVQTVSVTTSHVQIEVVLTRGGGISQLAFEGVSVGWQSPVSGPVHPQWVPLYRPDGLGWLAGFDEVLARCGLLNVGGPQFDDRGRLTQPLHGNLVALPCRTASVTYLPEADAIVIETTVDDVLFHFHHFQLRSRLMISCCEPRIELQDTVVNRGGRSGEILLLQHWNFGPPLAAAGSHLDVVAKQVAPRNEWAASQIEHWDRLGAPRPDCPESVYFIDPAADRQGLGMALLSAEDGRHALQMQWDSAAMPYLTIWKNPVALEDGYAVGIEPGTCYPNGREHECHVGRGRVLLPGQELQCRTVVAGFINQPDQVRECRRGMAEAQLAVERQIHRQPSSHFGPVA